MSTLSDVKITRSTLPPGDASVDKTVATMSRLAMGEYGARSPKIRQLAISIVNKAGVANKDYRGMAIACYRWVRDNIRYVKDPVGQEAVSQPEYTVETGAEDCDGMSTLVAALCGSLGINTRFAVVAVGSDNYSHVYLQAETTPGNWISLDPIMREHDAGWEAPSPTRKKVYAVNGPDGLSGLGALAMDGSIFNVPVGSTVDTPFVGDQRQILSFMRKAIPAIPAGTTYNKFDAADGGQSTMDPGLRKKVNEPLFGLAGLAGELRPAMPTGPAKIHAIRPAVRLESVGPGVNGMGADPIFGQKVNIKTSEPRRIDRNPLTQPSMARVTKPIPIAQGPAPVGNILDTLLPQIQKQRKGIFGLGELPTIGTPALLAIAVGAYFLLRK